MLWIPAARTAVGQRRFRAPRLLRPALGAALVVVLAANLGGSGIAGLPTGGRITSPEHVAQAKPGQRWGSAADAKSEVSGPGNTTVPQSLRGQYPLHRFEAEPLPVRNAATVAKAPPVDAVGYDAQTSQEQATGREAYRRVFDNADGTQTSEYSATPVNYQRADGSWAPIDTDLVPATDGGSGWRNTADAVGVRLASRADAAELARFEVDGSHTLAFGLADAAAVPGRADGDTVTYPGVLPGVDLRLSAQSGSVKETLVLRDAETPRRFVFPLRLTGLTAQVSDGQVVLTDAAGRQRAVIPAGYMIDAGTDGSQGPAVSSGVHYRIVESGGGPALEVTLDAAWLDDPTRSYPVEVDPTVALPVKAGAATGAMYVHPGGSVAGGTELLVGRTGSGNNAAYLRFDSLIGDLQHHTIYGAALQVVNYDAPSCRARPVSVHPVTANWSPSGGHSFPGPAVGSALATRSFARGHIATGQTQSPCPAAPELFDLGSAGQQLVQRWVNGTQANHGLSLRASTTDTSAWKRFASTGTANPPRLYITHSPYNASYAIPSPVPEPPVLQNQAGKVKVTVTNRSAEAWGPSTYYLAYRAYNARTGAAVTQQRAASLPGSVARNGRITLDATIAPLPPGRYFLDFTMVRAGGAVFTDHQVPPGRIVLEIFDIPPVVQELHPPNGYQAPTLTPQLWASALDIDAPPGSSLQYRFEVCDRGSTGDPTGCTNSGYQTRPAWTVPTGRLTWSNTYLWRVTVRDGGNEVPSPYSALLASVPQPEVTSRIAGAPYGSQEREFDAQVGNFSTAAIDAAVATVGPELNLVRTYNSLDPRLGSAFGAGWSSRYDMKLVPDNDGTGNVVITYPDGQTVRFGRNADGSFGAPQGRTARLTLESGSSYRLRDKSGSTYTFGLPGANTPGPLLEIADVGARKVKFSYDPVTARLIRAQVANSLTNQAGRSLFFTWTGNHVTEVRTDPVNGAALRWSYTYDGDRLTQVCAPDTTCTSYDYGTGSHYRSAVLDSRPESYWRLGEAEGTGAASEVVVNLGKDAGTYRNVTLGAVGPIAGTGNTAATFNGTTSHVELPKGALKKSRDSAVELWFKVNQTGTGGPLIGYQDKAVGTAATTGVPVLYVGTDGRLHGQFATGTATPITSTTLVNDGEWHHAVLSAMGSTQTLYLNGAKVGEMTGTIEHSAQTFNQIGAASATPAASWPAWGTTPQRHFNGQIDDVAIYSHPIGPATAADHNRYGRTPADQITRVTLPSGRVAAEVAYDVGLDRISEYTDRNGGTWKIGAPTLYGGDDDLRRGVQVLDPANRASLYEYDALAGRMLRSGTPMGISTREEDKPGHPAPVPTPAPTETVCSQPDPNDPGFCTIIPGEAGGPVFIPVTSESMALRSFTYDDRGFQSKVTNENGDSVEMGYDDRGNVTSKKTCRAADQCHTSYYTYPTGITNPLDPRIDLPVEFRDGRSSGPTDNRYRTRYTYTSLGSPDEQINPDSGYAKHTYTVGAEVAVGGGNPPANLPLTTTDGRQKVTRYAYLQNGDLHRVTAPNGLITEYGYDALGRKISEKQISDTYPAGVTTTFGYDTAGRLTTITGPTTTDAVSGVRHQAQTVHEYDADGNPTKSTIRDLLGGDPERVSEARYDASGRLEVAIDAEGNETRYGYDRFGNKTFEQDAKGNRYEYAYTARNAIAEVRLRDWSGDPAGAPDPGDYLVLHAYTYDYAGRMVSDTDAMGRRLEYLYWGDDLLRRVTLKGMRNPDGSTRDYVVEENTYDGAGHLTLKVAGNGRVSTSHEVDAGGKVTRTMSDPGGLSRRIDYTYDVAGNVTRSSRTGNWSNVPWSAAVTQEVVEYQYDDIGNMTRETVLGSTAAYATVYGYDRRGLLTSVTDPRGTAPGADPAPFTTNFVNDEVGQRIRTVAPPVSAESGGGPAATVRPTSTAGYNTFGDPIASTDPLGNVSRAEYDRLGRQTAAIAPVYLTPGGASIQPTSRTYYDALGNVERTVSPRQGTTRYTYDQLNRPRTRDEPATDDNQRAVWHYTYTRTGEVLSVTDPAGGRVESTYDDLDRQLTMTEVERHPVPENLTTRFGYDDAGNLTTLTTPGGATTTNAYDSVGAMTSSTSPNGVVTRFGYDHVGRQIRLSDGLGRTSRTNFDAFGRLVSEQDLAANQTVLRTQSYGYDRAGNLTTATDPLQRATTYTYDALNQLVRQVEPTSATTSITTSFGYDAAGNRTRYTDGRGNATSYTVNGLGLPESVVEPATAAHPAAADRTWTVSYDADANPVRLVAPGGVTRVRDFDLAGRLTGETGTGAQAATTSRSLGYDLLGRLTSAAAPGGTNTYQYNDRGGLLTSAGPSGSASFGYDDDGRVVSRTDRAGTATFTYDRGRLDTMTDALTGTVQSLDYDAAGQTSAIDYGAGRVRSFGYDNFGRLTSDTLRNSGGQTVASVGYEFNLNDQLTRKTTTGLAGAGENTYGYDHAGRLTSWTSAAGTVGYGWDDSGNRVRAGAKTASYDERNRLLSDGDYGYAYTPRGTLSTRTSSGLAEPYSFDAFDRMVSADGQQYTFDSLDRVAARNGIAFTYGGLSDELISDGAELYARGAADELLAVAAGTAPGATGQLTLADLHGDVVAAFDPTDTALPTLEDSTGYDPFGKPTASEGDTGNLGFQGDWTDPETGQVDMGARWYDPGTGGFTSRDSVTYGSGASILANRYTYAAGSPLDFSDPDGHWPSWVNKAANSFTNKVVSAASTVYRGVTTAASWAWSGVRTLGNAIYSGASWVWNKAKSAVNWAVQKVSQAARWVQDKASAAKDWVKQKAEQARQAAVQMARQVTAQAKRAVAYAVQHTPLKAVIAAAKPLLTGLAKVVSTVASLPARVVAVTRDVVSDVAKSVQTLYDKAVETAGAVVENVSKAVDAVTDFAQQHAATIAGIAVGVAVGVGCGVAIGWTGVGALACGALAGAAGAFVTGYLNGERGMDLAGSTALGGLFGLAGGALGSFGGAALGAGIRAASGGLRSAGQAAVGGLRAEASNVASGRLGGLVGRMRGCNSFAPNAAVAMANGTSKPIEDVQVGDLVLATDPTTGESGPRAVTDLIVGEGEKRLVEVTVDVDGAAGERTGTVTATDGHPFWVVDLDRWVDAEELRPGNLLRTAAGTYVQVTAIEQRTAPDQRVHNLTVDDLHTYYVIAGDTSVLVHNCVGSVPTHRFLPSRNAAFREAKRDLGIPMRQQPEGIRSVPMTNRDGSQIMNGQGRPVMTREYLFRREVGDEVIIQDHSFGHKFGEGGIGDQGRHLNVRPGDNPRTGKVPGTAQHYEY